MKIKYKLILMFILIILFASLPISLFILKKQEQEKLLAATHQGYIFSTILAQSIMTIILANGGDVKATQIDAKEMMAAIKTLKNEGLIYEDVILISSQKEYNGIILSSFKFDENVGNFGVIGNRISENDVAKLLNQQKFIEIIIPGVDDVFYEYTATANPPGKPPLCIGRLIFSKSIILASIKKLHRLIYGVTAFAIIIVSILGLFISRFISKPIDALTIATHKIEEGDLHYRIDIQSRDEIGKLSNTFNQMLKIINQKIDELERTNIRLTQLDVLKDEFLANISHELRTPLYGIIGISESLLRGATGKLKDETTHDLSLIVASGMRLAALVNDILDFSKLKHHDILLNLTPVNLYDVTQLILSITRPLFEKKSLVVNNNIDQKKMVVKADESRLQQIMLNLISNAIKFTDEGSITITAEVFEQNENMIAVSIIDTGIGIAPEHKDSIFESFEQIDGSITRTQGGTGLGLAISKKLIDLHGGKIWVDSEPGKGSKFIFTMEHTSERVKIKTINTDVANQYKEVSSVTGGGIKTDRYMLSETAEGIRKKVLVVDDEPVNLQVIINHLALEGYEVITAENGYEVFDLLARGNIPDLILLDVMLPRISGYDICRKIREEYTPHALPIIMLTAKDKPSDIVTGLSAGANDYLAKPVNHDELIARVQSLITMKESVKAQNELVIIKNELEIATEIQKTILPSKLPSMKNINFAARYESSMQVGGDFYDYHLVDDQRIGFLVADVAGHGIPAAMVASMLQVAYTFYKTEFNDPSQLFYKINAVMGKYAHGLFLTACCVYIDLGRKKLYHSNAGHRPLLIWQKSKQNLLSDKIYDRPIGVFHDSKYSVNEIDIYDNDRIILYTDGIVEARSPLRKIYGEDRFNELIRNSQDLNTEEFADHIIKVIKQWAGLNLNESLTDDVTLVVMDVTFNDKSS